MGSHLHPSNCLRVGTYALFFLVISALVGFLPDGIRPGDQPRPANTGLGSSPENSGLQSRPEDFSPQPIPEDSSPQPDPEDSTPQPSPKAAGLQWLEVQDNKILNEAGEVVLLRGANIAPAGPDWTIGVTPQDEIRAAERLTVAPPQGWGANLIVQSVFSGPVLRNDQDYLASLDALVARGKSNGAYTLLVYRTAEFSQVKQPPMPDHDAEHAMAELAARYSNEPAVIYGLQVEPHDVTWQMLQPRFISMIDAIRENNPKALIAVPGTRYGRYVHWAIADPIPRDNLVYKVHYYDPFTLFDTSYQLTAVSTIYPVLLTEFGAGTQMTLEDVRKLLERADDLGIGWAAWLFNDAACPCLLEDRSTLSTTPYGREIKARLGGLPPLSMTKMGRWKQME